MFPLTSVSAMMQLPCAAWLEPRLRTGPKRRLAALADACDTRIARVRAGGGVIS
jgi:hypothetical protein